MAVMMSKQKRGFIDMKLLSDNDEWITNYKSIREYLKNILYKLMGRDIRPFYISKKGGIDMNEIKFKDTKNDYLFSMIDGDSVVLVSLDNDPATVQCHYIDDQYFRFSGYKFSFWEFAKMAEENSCIFHPENKNVKTYSIYQITNVDNQDYVFMDYDFSKNRINAKDYQKVYMGMMSDKTTLEYLFLKHNEDYRPFRNKIRSLSVSDVIVVDDGKRQKAYYTDSFGFVEIPKFIHQLKKEKNEHVR